MARWRSDDAELVLLADDGAELLRYGRATPVGDWQVTAFLSGIAVASPLLATKITAKFADDGAQRFGRLQRVQDHVHDRSRGHRDLAAGGDQESAPRQTA